MCFHLVLQTLIFKNPLQLHPKSENLSEMVKDIVAQLEANFGDVSERMTTSPGIGSLWKSEALAKTLDEIPRIPICNQETGITPGFGKHLYVPSESIDLSKTVSGCCEGAVIVDCVAVPVAAKFCHILRSMERRSRDSHCHQGNESTFGSIWHSQSKFRAL